MLLKPQQCLIMDPAMCTQLDIMVINLIIMEAGHMFPIMVGGVVDIGEVIMAATITMDTGLAMALV